MVFELVIKGSRRNKSRIKENEVSIGKFSATFGQSFNEEIEENRYCEMYIDRPYKRIGFKFTKDEDKGWKTQFTKISYRIYMKVFSTIPKGIYKLKKEKGIWVTEVPEISKKQNSEDNK